MSVEDYNIIMEHLDKFQKAAEQNPTQTIRVYEVRGGLAITSTKTGSLPSNPALKKLQPIYERTTYEGALVIKNVKAILKLDQIEHKHSLLLTDDVSKVISTIDQEIDAKEQVIPNFRDYLERICESTQKKVQQ